MIHHVGRSCGIPGGMPHGVGIHERSCTEPARGYRSS